MDADEARLARGARGYRYAYLAKKYRLSSEEARGLILRIGMDREKLNAAAEALRRAHLAKDEG